MNLFYFALGTWLSPPCWTLRILLSLFPPPHPAGSSLRVTHPSSPPPPPPALLLAFFWFWLFGWVWVFFPSVGCKKKSGLGEKVKQMELWLSCQVPPLELIKSPAPPDPSPSSLLQKLQQFLLLFAGGGGRRNTHTHTPPGCVHCCGVFYCVTQFRGRCGAKTVWGKGELG